MSDLSKIKNEFLSFLGGIMQHVPPEAQPAANAAAQSVHDAISEAESAAVRTAEASIVPTLTAAAAKAVPVEFQGLVGPVIQLGVAALAAKASTPSPA